MIVNRDKDKRERKREVDWQHKNKRLTKTCFALKTSLHNRLDSLKADLIIRMRIAKVAGRRIRSLQSNRSACNIIEVSNDNSDNEAIRDERLKRMTADASHDYRKVITSLWLLLYLI